MVITQVVIALSASAALGSDGYCRLMATVRIMIAFCRPLFADVEFTDSHCTFLDYFTRLRAHTYTHIRIHPHTSTYTHSRTHTVARTHQQHRLTTIGARELLLCKTPLTFVSLPGLD